MNLRTLSIAVSSSMAYALAGCGQFSSNGDLTDVSGVVKKSGKPVVGAIVAFYPISEKGPASFGVTDEGGEFTLNINDKQRGALIGEHQVTVSCSRLISRPMTDAKGSSAKSQTPLSNSCSLPAEVGDLAKTPLKATVEADSEPIVIEIPAN